MLDLRERAGVLRTGYNARLAAMRSREAEVPIEVDVVGEIGPESGDDVGTEVRQAA